MGLGDATPPAGALTAWELGEEGVRHTIIADSAAGHLMQRGAVDLVLTGTDRVTSTGDVANKVGTYMKALAARDNGVPFLRSGTVAVDRLGAERWARGDTDRAARRT